MNFAFDSKETYLQYRADWKTRYALACAAIRQAKIDLKEANRAHAKQSNIGSLWKAHWALRDRREDVQKLYLELCKAKEQSRQQVLAQRNLST